MKSVRIKYKPARRGVALLLSVIFMLIFSTLAVSMAAMSGSSMQVARNVREKNRAFESAHTGLEVIRYWFNGITIAGTVPAEQRMQQVASKLQTKLASAGVTNINPVFNSATNSITIPDVTWDASGRVFSATVTQVGPDSIQAILNGHSTTSNKQIAVRFSYATVGNNVFNFGIATKGPLYTKGSVEVDGLNEAIEASVYIESSTDNLALSMIGKSSIAGNVSIVNPLASVDIGNSSSIGGASGADAMDNVFIGVPPADFPYPNPEVFKPYATNVMDSTTSTSGVTLENVIIPAGLNPKFTGNCTLKGVIYVEQPNTVEFAGNAEIIGVIAAEGDVDSPSSSNQLLFTGTVNSQSIETLVGTQFDGLKAMTGTFIMAPGFSVKFGGNFDSLNGVIAANGVEFYGNAGGTINGSVVNYSDIPMSLDGNTDLIFNRSGIDKNPAGFEPSTMIQFLPNTYNELL